MLLEKIVGALAQDQFRWRSGGGRQSAVANICRAIKRHVVIDDGAVRPRLRAIAQGGAQRAGGKPLEPAASAKVLESLRKIALGIAMEKFGWQVGANNQAAEARMMQAIERQGVPMEDDTLRRCLHEAERHLKNSSKLKSD